MNNLFIKEARNSWNIATANKRKFRNSLWFLQKPDEGLSAESQLNSVVVETLKTQLILA